MISLMIRKEFRQLRRDRRMLPIVFVAPVLQLLLLGYAANLDPKDIPAIICDMDRTPQSRELSREFFASGYFLQSGAINNQTGIASEMERLGASAALVIPRGFGEDMEQGRAPQVPYIADGSDSSTAAIAMGYAQNIVRRYALEYHGGSAIPRIDVRTRIFFNPALKSRNFMVPGLLALVLLVMTLILTSLAVVKEKEIGTMEQLIVTPLKTRDILLGKLLPFALIGVLDVLLVIGASRIIFGLHIAGSFALLFGLSMLFLLNTLSLGLLVSTFSENQQQAMMASVFFVMVPMIMLSGFVFPVENMPRVIQFVTFLLPLRYYFTIVRGIYLNGAGIVELWNEALALLILGVVTLGISLARFRKRLE
jgi:ABC-2 type transport system permease protein